MPSGSLRRVADPTDSAAVRAAVVATYGTASETDTATLVAQYERVRDYCATHPQQGSGAVASALDLPRGRIRSWVDGDGRPDAVRGLDRLTARGWLHLAWDATELRALAGLVAWVVAGGAVGASAWQPSFSVADGTAGDLRRLGAVLGIDWEQRHSAREQQGTYWVPDDDGGPLGRLLAVLGAPVGRAPGPDLPTWTVRDDCPRALRLDLARIIVRQRGTVRDDLSTMPIQLRLTKPGRRQAVVELLDGLLADGPGEVRTDDGAHVRLDARAAEVLGTPPALGNPLPGCE